MPFEFAKRQPVLFFHDFQNHQAECAYIEVQCPNSECTEKLLKKDMGSHVESRCLWRIIRCEYCQELLIFNNKQVSYA